MARHKRKRHKGGHGGPPGTEAVLAELDARAAELAAADPAGAGPLWGEVHKLLLRAHADPSEAARVIAGRDADGLTRLVRVLRGLEVETPEEAQPARADVPAETMARAMRAFRKRLKLVRLDHESRLGVGPMTSGRKHDVDAILAPQEFPAEVWEALADAGELKRAGQGFYMLAEEG